MKYSIKYVSIQNINNGVNSVVSKRQKAILPSMAYRFELLNNLKMKRFQQLEMNQRYAACCIQGFNNGFHAHDRTIHSLGVTAILAVIDQVKLHYWKDYSEEIIIIVGRNYLFNVQVPYIMFCDGQHIPGVGFIQDVYNIMTKYSFLMALFFVNLLNQNNIERFRFSKSLFNENYKTLQ